MAVVALRFIFGNGNTILVMGEGEDPSDLMGPVDLDILTQDSPSATCSNVG